MFVYNMSVVYTCHTADGVFGLQPREPGEVEVLYQHDRKLTCVKSSCSSSLCDAVSRPRGKLEDEEPHLETCGVCGDTPADQYSRTFGALHFKTKDVP